MLVSFESISNRWAAKASCCANRIQGTKLAVRIRCSRSKRLRDAEAQVVGHEPGRHRGRLGALLVVLPNGTRFAVGTGFTDAQRELPPSIGSTITFRYQELTDGGVPRFPSFVRVCE
jgi:hypothetical protein